jgi:exopolyphosphatase/guanosine-5'-triphosphate,3'-diphosphate pyrophosphatase
VSNASRESDVVANVAALDCGTNSTRLLVADRFGNPLARRTRITRLGEGVDATGRLSDEAIERTAGVLASYREEMNTLGVARARLVATSAARDAMNSGQFLDAVFRSTGLAAELLSGYEEGTLSFAGATSDLPSGSGPYLVIDIGGGSTELIVGDALPLEVVSLDIGCVRLAERFLHHDPPQTTEMEEAATEATRQLRSARGELRLDALERRPPSLIALAGTVSTLASVHQGLETYVRDRVHHAVLSLEVVNALLEEMAVESVASRRARPGMDPARADVIIGGAVILVSAMRTLGFEECLVSEADILDGIVLSLVQDS